jgi:formate--tetrahydrofolate ligase
VNVFSSDTAAEKQAILDYCEGIGVAAALSEGWAKGGEGCQKLGELVVNAAQECSNRFTPTYSLEDSVPEKITKVAQTIYGASAVAFSQTAQNQLKKIEKLGLSHLPICIAKTQKSLSDNEKLIGRPTDFTITIREFEIAAGAGFLIPIAGEILRMPGLPETPSAESVDISPEGLISGLF